MAEVQEVSSPVIPVGEYKVDMLKILGRGSFGTVHLGSDLIGRNIAAKHIIPSNEEKRNDCTEQLKNLIHLDHSNVVKIYDVDVVMHKSKNIWCFMEFCEKGDLNKYFQETKPTIEGRMALMKDTALGLKYLHDKQIVHRDIKPSNILVDVAGTAKLTDFDLSKILGQDCDTSRMSSSVGTRWFKAPEFFLRNEKMKISYHRSVDVYALGLTFLALLQGTKPQLMPQIETNKDSDELHQPIGWLISVRSRKNQDTLDVIPDPRADDLESGIRRVILKMTRFSPQHRLTAAEIVQQLEEASNPEPYELRDEKLPLHQTDTKATESSQRKTSQKENVYRLGNKYWTRLQTTTNISGNEDTLFARGKYNAGTWQLVEVPATEGRFQGIASVCQHSDCPILTQGKGGVLEGCMLCKEIRYYGPCHDTSRFVSCVVHRGLSVSAICLGWRRSVFAKSDERVVHLDWTSDSTQLIAKGAFKHEGSVSGMVWVEPDIVVLADWVSDSIEARKISDKSVLWKVSKNLQPLSVCCDAPYDFVFVLSAYGKVVMLDIKSGKMAAAFETGLGTTDIATFGSPARLAILSGFFIRMVAKCAELSSQCRQRLALVPPPSRQATRTFKE